MELAVKIVLWSVLVQIWNKQHQSILAYDQKLYDSAYSYILNQETLDSLGPETPFL